MRNVISSTSFPNIEYAEFSVQVDFHCGSERSVWIL